MATNVANSGLENMMMLTALVIFNENGLEPYTFAQQWDTHKIICDQVPVLSKSLSLSLFLFRINYFYIY